MTITHTRISVRIHLALREEIFLEALHYYPPKRDLYLAEQQLLGPQAVDLVANCRLLVPGESQYSSDDEDHDANGDQREIICTCTSIEWQL